MKKIAIAGYHDMDLIEVTKRGPLYEVNFECPYCGIKETITTYDECGGKFVLCDHCLQEYRLEWEYR